jgi:sugar O-acyltransferase (sialic acid O-acetyltransferase NeuD family)
MTRPLVVVGAGGFGRETLDVVEACNSQVRVPQYRLLGVVDSAPRDVNLARLAGRGIRYLGTEVEWLASGEDADYLIGVGHPSVRVGVEARFAREGKVAATVVHPTATLGSNVTLGRGVVICAGVQVSTNVTLGRHVHLNPNATIGHDSVIGDYVSVNPGAIVSGDVAVGRESLLGAGSVVLQGLIVGRGATVGAAACVTRNVADGVIVKGVPAR